MVQQFNDSDAERVDDVRVALHHESGVPATLFATPEVPVGRDALAQLGRVLDLERNLGELTEAGHFGDTDTPRIHRAALMPDTHKGPGVPVGCALETEGFVLPGAIGNDIGCGMRLLALDLEADAVDATQDALHAALRGIYFGGKRDIPMTPTMRAAMLQRGLAGLHETHHEAGGAGIWSRYDASTEAEALSRVHRGGQLRAEGLFTFEDYVRGSGGLSHDAHIGSVGGGNHFVELQRVAEVRDGHAAWDWGLTPGALCVMVHSGSVGFGHAVGGHFRRAARAALPTTCGKPPRGFDPLPIVGPHAELGRAYLDAMAAAANFAFANRLFLGMMAVAALEQALGRTIRARLVYDASHNLLWPEEGGRVLHRKGATPALGPEPMVEGSPFRYTGHPVLIPGSMGSSSYVLSGHGSDESLLSACHGAGRAMSRGKARALARDEEVQHLQVVTPVDPRDPALRGRRDVLGERRKRVLEEAPSAYKPITPVIETVEAADIAHVVARVEPLLTIKG